MLTRYNQNPPDLVWEVSTHVRESGNKTSPYPVREEEAYWDKRIGDNSQGVLNRAGTRCLWSAHVWSAKGCTGRSGVYGSSLSNSITLLDFFL